MKRPLARLVQRSCRGLQLLLPAAGPLARHACSMLLALGLSWAPRLCSWRRGAPALAPPLLLPLPLLAPPPLLLLYPPLLLLQPPLLLQVAAVPLLLLPLLLAPPPLLLLGCSLPPLLIDLTAPPLLASLAAPGTGRGKKLSARWAAAEQEGATRHPGMHPGACNQQAYARYRSSPVPAFPLLPAALAALPAPPLTGARAVLVTPVPAQEE